ncbi:ABC transporter substrate-binding protein [Subtercola lobariae]|uniref:ABC transporter substrate-binding protein n=1 Tax=Subtercola lobariae TaxID=1588641 RepID=A0A917B3G4_9MICO|nr:extracellular solute-binding protein [Subtercola lobariae]GGF20844.1 ABC transporter substrate-binding protein [Subtercola lobariae]
MKAFRVTAVIAVSAAAIALTGCSAGSSEDANTLTVLTSIQSGTPTGDVQDKIVAEVEKATGANIKLVQAGETLPDVYETSVAGGKEADVAITNLAEKSNDWVKNGVAVPASNYLDAWGLTAKITPDALDAWKDSDGKVQGFPYNGFVWPVWYNMALLNQAGITTVPTSTDELISDAQKLNDAGIPPFIIGGNDWSGQKLFLQIAQSYMTPDEATAVYSKGGYCASPDAMKGINLFTQLRDANVFVKDSQGYTADQMDAAFYAGKAAMMSAGSWAFGDAPADLQSNVQLGGFPQPSGGSYDKPTAYQGYTGSGFFVSPNGAKDAKIGLVQKFISAWYEPDNAAAYAAASNGPTAVIATGTPAAIDNKITAAAVNDVPKVVDYAVMPDTVVPGALDDPMIRQTSLAYAPGTDAQAICSSLDSLYTS